VKGWGRVQKVESDEDRIKRGISKKHKIAHGLKDETPLKLKNRNQNTGEGAE